MENHTLMRYQLSHERLDLYKVYLEAASLCADIISQSKRTIIAFDHLDRAMESIGINFMRANAQDAGSAQYVADIDVSIASTHECAASIDVCLARQTIEESTYTACMGKLWRVRGMLLGLKRSGSNQMREEFGVYGKPQFPFMVLDMYGFALEAVHWVQCLVDELKPKAKVCRKLDISTTGTVLNIAEGHGRSSVADQNRFMKIAQKHAYQLLLMLDLMVARNEISSIRIGGVKDTQSRVISMLQAWCTSNENRAEENIG